MLLYQNIRELMGKEKGQVFEALNIDTESVLKQHLSESSEDYVIKKDYRINDVNCTVTFGFYNNFLCDNV